MTLTKLSSRAQVYGRLLYPLCATLISPILLISLIAPVYCQSPEAWVDPSPHRASFVTVDKDVRLEVLDWGGSGKPVVPLAGGGNTAHASFSAYAKWSARVNGFAFPESEFRQTRATTPDGGVGNPSIPAGAAGIGKGMKRYTTIPVPALVIFAAPHDQGAWIKASSYPAVQEAAKTFAALEMRLTERQAKAIEEGVPTARVVRIAGAHHIFLSNEADVLREMRAFHSGPGNK